MPVDVTDTLRCFRETLEKSKYRNRSIRHSRKLLSLFLAQTQGKIQSFLGICRELVLGPPVDTKIRGCTRLLQSAPLSHPPYLWFCIPRNGGLTVLALHPFLFIYPGYHPVGVLCSAIGPSFPHFHAHSLLPFTFFFLSSGLHLCFSHFIPTKALPHSSASLPSVKRA